MFNVKSVGFLLVVALLSFSAGKFLTSPKIEIREVEKVSTKERTDLTRNVDKKETIRPDGTRIIETSSSTKRSTDTSVDKESSKEHITSSRPGWHFSVTYQPTLVTIQDQNITLDIQRRLFSEIYLGASVSTQKTIGISIGVGF